MAILSFLCVTSSVSQWISAIVVPACHAVRVYRSRCLLLLHDQIFIVVYEFRAQCLADGIQQYLGDHKN